MPKRKITEDSSKKIRTLSLITTRACNLHCSYCYEKNHQADCQFMEFKTAQEVINHYMRADDEFDSVLVEFFGGEPLLAFPFIKKVVEWTISRKWPKAYHFFISTNGTLMTDDMKNWLQKSREYLTASFSIDGTKMAHNLVRDNSYDLLYPHIPFFMETWPGQPAKMTICADTIPYIADSVIELEEMGLFFTANIAFEGFWGSAEHKEKLLGIYNDQLMLLVDYYAERPHLYPVSKLLEALPIYLCIPEFRIYSANDKDCTRFCGSGHEMVTVDVDGEIYPCHRFLPWITGKPAPKGPANIQSRWEPENCVNCKIVSSCPTCAGYNWEMNGDSGIRTTFHCEAYKLEVLASAKLASLKLEKVQLSEIEKFPPDEQKKLNQRIEAILELVENGI